MEFAELLNQILIGNKSDKNKHKRYFAHCSLKT